MPKAGTAGGSARREYERRRQRDRERTRARLRFTLPVVLLSFPVVFVLVRVGASVVNNALTEVTSNSAGTAGTPKQLISSATANLLALLFASSATVTLARDVWGRRRTTTAWRIGAEGEQQTGRRLAQLESAGFRLLHDCAIPGHRANIDHVVVGPTGIFTVETKSYRGKIEIARPLFAPAIVKHNGRRAQKVNEQAQRQATVVSTIARTALPGLDLHVQPLVAVHRASVDVGWFVRPVVDGVRWCSGRDLVRVIKRHRSSLTADEIATIADALETNLLREHPGVRVSSPEPADAPEPVEQTPLCPCGEAMVRRVRRSDGTPFYGCSTFPACRVTRPI